MITIENFIILLDEINRNSSNIGFNRTLLTKSNEEYTIGKNRYLFQINIRNKSPLYRISLELYLSKDKLIFLEELYNQQQSERLQNYNIGDNINATILYSYTNPTSKKKFCFLEAFELIDSIFILNQVKYKCKLDIVEI